MSQPFYGGIEDARINWTDVRIDSINALINTIDERIVQRGGK